MDQIQEFYDQFTAHQKNMGINHRHLSIQRLLEANGLKREHNVLEVGCGIGTLTELILRYLSNEGSLLGLDISPKSIEIANQRLSKYANATLKVDDLTKRSLDQKFDVIVLPDVIEHIPLELHKAFFLNLSKMLRPTGFIFIHIPDPNYLQWCIDAKKDGLQIIDQPIHTHLLSENLRGSNLYIHSLKSYSVFLRENDYQAIVLKHIPTVEQYNPVKPKHDPLMRRIIRKARYLIRGNK